jgi:glutathione-independent formaldehyde dehydrogenase
VGVGSTVYVAGAGPVGLAAAVSARLLGAACVIVGDLNPARLAQARKHGFETIDVSAGPIPDQIAAITGEPVVDAGVDAVGFEARGCGRDAALEQPASVLNSMFEVVKAGGGIGLPGLYVTEDPGAADAAAQQGSLSMRLGLGWAKSHSIATGQCPVMKYHKQLMQAILYDRVNLADVVNVRLIDLADAPAAYADFDKGASVKYVIDPHGDVRSALGVKGSQVA